MWSIRAASGNAILLHADSVRMYKNNRFYKEYKKEDFRIKFKDGPILIDDFIEMR
jgi:beta-galactosidase